MDSSGMSQHQFYPQVNYQMPQSRLYNGPNRSLSQSSRHPIDRQPSQTSQTSRRINTERQPSRSGRKNAEVRSARSAQSIKSKRDREVKGPCFLCGVHGHKAVDCKNATTKNSVRISFCCRYFTAVAVGFVIGTIFSNSSF